ncbi:MAG: hypothetical protein HGB29_04010 [Chlorobiaceae bacterium]|nr:hypothetical protein [Chlorobiaceae bacterium]NTW74007.1 hypothetical protein [Chlorobiaceae bacterium]
MKCFKTGKGGTQFTITAEEHDPDLPVLFKKTSQRQQLVVNGTAIQGDKHKVNAILFGQAFRIANFFHPGQLQSGPLDTDRISTPSVMVITNDHYGCLFHLGVKIFHLLY